MVYQPRRSIYTPDHRLHHKSDARVSGYSRRPIRPYFRHSQLGSVEPVVIPPNCAPLLKGEDDSASLVLPHYIDSSMLAIWRSCKRKHFWSTLNALYPRGQSVHLIAGGAIASGVEAARRRVFCDPDPTNVTHQATLEAAYPAFNTAWGTYQPPDNPRNAKTFVNTWAALVDYLEKYPPATDPVQPLRRAGGDPATEYRFAIELPINHPVTNDPILFVGRFDMVGFYSQFNVPVVLDEKTTQSFGMGWAESWELRGQFMGYIWALRQQGMDISHAVVRGIAIQKTQFDTREAFISYPNHLITRWADQMLRDVEHICASYEALTTVGDQCYSPNENPTDRYYPYNLADSCQSYGGCAFANLCSAQDYNDFTSAYTRHVWNPLEPNQVQEDTPDAH